MRRAYSVLTFGLGALVLHACASNPIASGAGGAGGNGSGGSASGGNGSGGAPITATGGTGAGGSSATKASGGGSGGGTDAAIGSGGTMMPPTTIGRGGSTGTGGSGGTPGTGGGAGSTPRADAATDATGGTGGASYDAGTGGTAGCDKDLTGTWDLYTTSLASGPVSATLVLGVDGFTFNMRAGQLAYAKGGTMSATYKTSSGTRLITVQNTPATVNSGSFPVALGGHWTLASNHETCTLDVAAGTVKANCNGRPDEYNVAADDWPYIIPSPENGRNYLFSRTSTSTSQFGDFGGQWTARSDTGSGQGCVFQVQGSTFTSTCVASNDFDGVMRLTIGSDCSCRRCLRPPTGARRFHSSSRSRPDRSPRPSRSPRRRGRCWCSTAWARRGASNSPIRWPSWPRRWTGGRTLSSSPSTTARNASRWRI
jgi:hypothetical protein